MSRDKDRQGRRSSPSPSTRPFLLLQKMDQAMAEMKRGRSISNYDPQSVYLRIEGAPLGSLHAIRRVRGGVGEDYQSTQILSIHEEGPGTVFHVLIQAWESLADYVYELQLDGGLSWRLSLQDLTRRQQTDVVLRLDVSIRVQAVVEAGVVLPTPKLPQDPRRPPDPKEEEAFPWLEGSLGKELDYGAADKLLMEQRTRRVAKESLAESKRQSRRVLRERACEQARVIEEKMKQHGTLDRRIEAAQFAATYWTEEEMTRKRFEHANDDWQRKTGPM